MSTVVTLDFTDLTLAADETALVVVIFALWNRADHYIFALWFLLLLSFFFFLA